MISFEEFKQRKKDQKYKGTEEDIKKEYEVYVEACELSMQPQEKVSIAKKHKAADDEPPSQEAEVPGLTIFFYFLAILSLIGGLILASIFWPGDPGFGNEWKTTAYTWSIIWASAAVVEAAIFAAIGSILSYLNRIAVNTEKWRIPNKQVA